MEIVNIEARTYEAMMSRFEQFARRVDSLCEQHRSKEMKEWLDNQDVCAILNISKRTLQTLRDNGTLGYTMIGNKAYYKPEDVQNIIGKVSKGREAKYGK